MEMSKNEILSKLTELDSGVIARELGCSITLVRKALRQERKNETIWRMAEAIAIANDKKMKSVVKAGKELVLEHGGPIGRKDVQ